MSALLLAFALFAAAEPAAAPASTETAAAASPELKPGERRAKMVCRTETPTGSRVGKRVCLTAEDLARRTEESEKGFGEMQRSLNTTYSKGN
jgi:hypothetical protein